MLSKVQLQADDSGCQKRGAEAQLQNTELQLRSGVSNLSRACENDTTAYGTVSADRHL